MFVAAVSMEGQALQHECQNKTDTKEQDTKEPKAELEIIKGGPSVSCEHWSNWIYSVSMYEQKGQAQSQLLLSCLKFKTTNDTAVQMRSTESIQECC